MDHKIDVTRILSYPITPVPLALCHLDGTIYETDKSALAKCLEAKIDPNPPGYSDIYLDGFFILHAMKEIPKTFGSISKRFLQMITKYPANRIDVIFDQYWHPSIKDHERQLRKEAPLINYSITGPDQKLKKQMMKFILMMKTMIQKMILKYEEKIEIKI
ncbi:hypothetical protein JTB14_019325 [Gonioctena quinquepunctata]|nr:hypothetical protein JTB14_019325 [Gonioctena quinquepunctata]